MDNIQKLTYNHSNFKRKRKIMMICDNEPDVLLLFEHVFRSKYDLIIVGSGEECIERYIEATNRGNKISLILLDYKLEGMWGDTVARKIREYNGTKIILNSAYNVDDVLVKELENGNYISKYIQKPIETDCLTELVAEIIKN
jgi:CheY-like chemotaxis protein